MSYSRDGRSASPRDSLSPPPRGRRSRSLSRSRRSRSRSRDSVGVVNPGNNLYVTGLSTRVNTSDLEKFFNCEGKVMECHLVTDPRTKESRGFAFVTMETNEDAERCIKHLNRSVLEGRLITVEKAKRRRGRTPTPGKYQGPKGRQGYGPRRSRSYSPRRRHDRAPYHRDRPRRSRSPYGRRADDYDSYGRYRDRSLSPRGRGYSRAHSHTRLLLLSHPSSSTKPPQITKMSASTTPSSSLSFFSSSIFHHRHRQSSQLLFKTNKHQLSLTTTSAKALIRSELATLPIFSFEGTQVGSTTLNLKSAPLDTARSVVHRGLTTDLRNRRRGTASTLTRSEVRGGGIKPYPQKKTGRARRGSQRTPLRPGGGVVFGPKPKDWSVKINKKEKKLAISTAISSAVENTIVVEDFEDKFEKPKTKEFIALMRRWGLDPKEKSVFLMTEVPDNVMLSGRNIGTLKMLIPRTLNLFDILDSEKLVFTQGAVEFLNERYGFEYSEEDDDEEGEEEGEEGLEAEEKADD